MGVASNSSAAATPSVEIIEVGPRDGLQNERQILATDLKLAFIEHAIAAGVRRIEVASFVRPDRVPQMADAEALIAALPQRDDVRFIGLVLNLKGAERALGTRIDELGAVCVASDVFAAKNQGQTAEESLDVAISIVDLARRTGRRAHVTIGAAFGCPFEGEVDPDKVLAMAVRAAEAGAVEVSLADTIGVAVPTHVAALVGRVSAAIGPVPVRGHFHNTRNTAIANVWAAVSAGARVIDSSLGGLGGCPFAPRATGNVPTEDVAYMLERSGVSTGLDLEATISAANWLSEAMGRQLPGLVSRAGLFPNINTQKREERA